MHTDSHGQRWFERLSQWENALSRLEDAVRIEKYVPLEKAGLIKTFEIVFELAWKTLKDHLEYSGTELNIVAPRNVIKQAFAAGLIENGQGWIDMLEARNMMSHTYSEADADHAVRRIREDFFPLIRQAYRHLKGLGDER